MVLVTLETRDRRRRRNKRTEDGRGKKQVRQWPSCWLEPGVTGGRGRVDFLGVNAKHPAEALRSSQPSPTSGAR